VPELCEGAVPYAEGVAPRMEEGCSSVRVVPCGGGWSHMRLGIGRSDRNWAGTLCRLELAQATGSRWNVCGENMR
jgi:hypothetical protein